MGGFAPPVDLVSLPLPQWGDFPPVVVGVSAPPTMGRFPPSSWCLCPSHNGGDFLAVVGVSAPPTMGRFPPSSWC
ncbi:unnamed protein product, partial [Staurois parvus]